MKKVSEDFYLKEVECKCGNCRTIVDDEFVSRLQSLRNAFDEPIKINSWFRCKDYNKKVGGKPNSIHVLGRAVDIGWKSFDSEKKYRLLQGVIFYGFDGIGLATDFLHIDLGKKKKIWFY